MKIEQLPCFAPKQNFLQIKGCNFEYATKVYVMGLVEYPDCSSFVPEKYFSFFSTKTYVVGTQKNRLIEMCFLSTQNMLKIMAKKIFKILP